MVRVGVRIRNRVRVRVRVRIRVLEFRVSALVLELVFQGFRFQGYCSSYRIRVRVRITGGHRARIEVWFRVTLKRNYIRCGVHTHQWLRARV